MKRPKVCAAVGAVLLSMGSSYGVDPFIVSGYPVDNPNKSRESAGISMETSGVSCRTPAAPLEARYRTILESIGIKLNTFMARGFAIFIK